MSRWKQEGFLFINKLMLYTFLDILTCLVLRMMFMQPKMLYTYCTRPNLLLLFFQEDYFSQFAVDFSTQLCKDVSELDNTISLCFKGRSNGLLHGFCAQYRSDGIFKVREQI